MAVKKTQIYSSLWASCDKLRGGMDASLYKDYILVLLFVKYVSDRYAGDPNALIEVPDGGSFADMINLIGDAEIGEKIDLIITKLAEANDLQGVIDVASFNDPDKFGSGATMSATLSDLIRIFDRKEMNFTKNSAEGDDILGDAYEYLMRKFATESGKSKGQFYTPAEVSRIMAKVIGIGNAKSAAQTIYDPACGSGSLLLKAHDEAPYDLTIYGQEKDVATRALAKMNMVLHNCPTAEVWRENTLVSPHFVQNDGSLKTFDYVVANPPFSDKAWTTGLKPNEDKFKRFSLGIPPKMNGDYAYLLHVIASLKSTGKGAVILPHGVLFRGNAEGAIRQNLITRGYIKGIIGLPSNLFYGTGIPACIIVLDKEGAHTRNGIFMIDASKGYIQDGSKNRLREQDIHKIVDAFSNCVEIDKYSRMVPMEEIIRHWYNLNIPRYIDSSEPEDLHDIEAHLRGGIPQFDIDNLQAFWDVMPSLRNELFQDGDRPKYSTAKLTPDEVKPTIIGHVEFSNYSNLVLDVFNQWKSAHVEKLKNIAIGDKPKNLIKIISEDLLSRFAKVPLIENYDIYQVLMNYWSDIMQDDIYLISVDGWKVGGTVRELIKDKDGKFSEEADFIIGKGKNSRRYKAEIIPPNLVVTKYFQEQKLAIEDLESQAENLTQELEGLKEEHLVEDGLLWDAKTDKDDISPKSISGRLKEIKNDADFKNEIEILHKCEVLLKKQKELTSKANELKSKLDETTLNQYRNISIDELKSLIVDGKWFGKLEKDLIAKINKVSQDLTSRIKLLCERYEKPLPQIEKDVRDATAKVEAHLKRMGFQW